MGQRQRPDAVRTVVGRPVYAVLGYSLADFLRVTAGAVVLQHTSTAPDGISPQSVLVRPYMGLSVDLDQWLGIGDKSRMSKKYRKGESTMKKRNHCILLPTTAG